MPSVINASTSLGLQQTADTSGVLQLQTANTTAVTIDANQNVGIGVTPSPWAGFKVIDIGSGGAVASSSGTDFRLYSNAYVGVSSAIYKTTGAATAYTQISGAHAWYNASSGTAGNAISFTQAMTLDSSGNLLVGTTSAISSSKVAVVCSMNAFNGLVMQDTGSVGGNYVQFLNSVPAQAGAITHNGTTTVLYTTSSDHRLKENVTQMTGALEKVAQLRPVTFNWISDGSEGEGFIAHELQKVKAGAVSGEKDAVDADGNPKYQGIDTSFLVATLTAAIQEQQALITTLTERITALEGK